MLFRSEARAGRVQADVYDGTATAPGLKKEGLALKWIPDSAQRLPKHYIDAEGFWTTSNLYVMLPGFNTELVRKGTEPRTYEELLDPKWKGKLSWSRSPAASAGPGFVGLMLKDRGEEKGMAYLRELAKQNITSIDGSARQLLDQIMAGEYPIGLGLFNHQFVISQAKGAPIEWIPMEPAMAALSTIGVTKDAPHPNAGKLLVDFLVSSEGQAFFRDANYLPADPATPPTEPRLIPEIGKYRAQYFTPEEIQDNMPKWAGIFRELFR